jgi:hypothetical protein
MITDVLETPTVTVRSQHSVIWRCVEIAFKDNLTPEVCYHFIGPKNALALLKQLEAQRETLEQLVEGE